MNLGDEKLQKLKLAGSLHDIGESLTGLEADKIKRHPEIGYQIDPKIVKLFLESLME